MFENMFGKRRDEDSELKKGDKGYGFCPECGAPGVSRERRPNGDDRCANGHIYPSAVSTPTPIKTPEKV